MTSLFNMALPELRAERERVLRELLATGPDTWTSLYRRLGLVHKIIERRECGLWPLKRKEDTNA